MSASDAAPLPRLGEVFFDVRGNSRSMRLSWYADTGVAVFSIWQGGMCTGTFRLPIADLPRMIDTLQRGPAGQARQDPQAQAEAFASGPVSAAGYRTGQAEYAADYPSSAAGYPPEAAGHRSPPAEPPADRASHRTPPAEYPTEYQARAPGRSREADSYRHSPTVFTPEPDRYPASPAPFTPEPDRYPASPAAFTPEPDRYPASPAGYDPEPAGQHAGTGTDYPARRSAYPANPDYQAPDYQARPEAYLPEPPSPRDVLAYRPEPGSYQQQSGEQRTEYLTGLDELDYRRAVPAAHYSRDSSAAGYGDAMVSAAADYPAHYRTALTDDSPESMPEESFRYGEPAGNRGSARHATPDTPFG